MWYGAFYVICPRASSQYVTPLINTLTNHLQEALSINRGVSMACPGVTMTQKIYSGP